MASLLAGDTYMDTFMKAKRWWIELEEGGAYRTFHSVLADCRRVHARTNPDG